MAAHRAVEHLDEAGRGDPEHAGENQRRREVEGPPAADGIERHRGRREHLDVGDRQLPLRRQRAPLLLQPLERAPLRIDLALQVRALGFGFLGAGKRCALDRELAAEGRVLAVERGDPALQGLHVAADLSGKLRRGVLELAARLDHLLVVVAEDAEQAVELVLLVEERAGQRRERSRVGEHDLVGERRRGGDRGDRAGEVGPAPRDCRPLGAECGDPLGVALGGIASLHAGRPAVGVHGGARGGDPAPLLLDALVDPGVGLRDLVLQMSLALVEIDVQQRVGNRGGDHRVERLEADLDDVRPRLLADVETAEEFRQDEVAVVRCGRRRRGCAEERAGDEGLRFLAQRFLAQSRVELGEAGEPELLDDPDRRIARHQALDLGREVQLDEAVLARRGQRRCERAADEHPRLGVEERLDREDVRQRQQGDEERDADDQADPPANEPDDPEDVELVARRLRRRRGGIAQGAGEVVGLGHVGRRSTGVSSAGPIPRPA